MVAAVLYMAAGVCFGGGAHLLGREWGWGWGRGNADEPSWETPCVGAGEMRMSRVGRPLVTTRYDHPLRPPLRFATKGGGSKTFRLGWSSFSWRRNVTT